MYRVLLCSLLACCPLTAFTKENVWIIGGGQDPEHSQAQIEFNVNWAIASLKKLVPDASLHVFYANGKAPDDSVTEWHRAVDGNTPLQPLARVFGERFVNGLVFRKKQVPNVEGSSRVDVLKPALQQEFARLHREDRALIIYNGHGGTTPKDAAGNTFQLWRDTQLSAREFEKLLDSLNPNVPVRFVLAQCFAGGFARAVHPHARDMLELAPGKRCGFFAVPKDKKAEGCSPSVNIGDYRDYTTYFFGALTGQTPLGAPIEGQPDLNHDGVVTPYEAHLYVMVEAQSTDIPQSTSEVFLDRWQPWYLRWLDAGALPDNVYGRLARSLAHRNGLSETGYRMGKDLDLRRNHLKQKLEALKEEQTTLQGTMEKLQNAMRKDLSYKWPQILHPYTANFSKFLTTDLDAAQRFIRQHPDYQELVKQQERIDQIDLDILQLNRKIAQFDKILRLRALARELDQLEHFATPGVKADYAHLLECEQLPL